MYDLSKFSTQYRVRYMSVSDADALLAFCLQNDQYYRYCGKQPSRELILHDLHITPPDTPKEAKYYVGFYEGDILVAIMDLIDGYPDSDTAFIGFFDEPAASGTPDRNLYHSGAMPVSERNGPETGPPGDR